MSHDLSLVHKKTRKEYKIKSFPNNTFLTTQHGGTIRLGVQDNEPVEVRFNFTYNYYNILKDIFHSDEGIKCLYNIPIDKVIVNIGVAVAVLMQRIREQGITPKKFKCYCHCRKKMINEKDVDYWTASYMNVFYALMHMYNLLLCAITDMYLTKKNPEDYILDGD